MEDKQAKRTITLDYCKDLTDEVVDTSPKPAQQIGQRVRSLRKEKGFSLGQLSSLTGFMAFVALLILCLISSTNTWAAGRTYGGLVIGVPSEDIRYRATIYDAGAIHVLQGSSSGISAADDQFWTQDSPGILGGSEFQDFFGGVLATGDFNGDNKTDLAIGVPYESVGSKGWAGAVNVLYGSGKKLTGAGNQLWTQGSPGILGAVEATDLFGYALTVGDFDGDGKMDLAIGAPFEDVSGKWIAGAVNIIYGSRQGLISSGNQLLVQSSWRDGVEEEDLFGYSIAAGDFDGNGYYDLAVGVPGEDDDNGAITVWYGSTSGLVPPVGGLAVIHRGWAGIPGSGYAAFGSALAVGDFNSDGYADLAAGAPKADYGSGGNVGDMTVMYGSATGLLGSGSPPAQLWRQDLIRGSDLPETSDEFGSVLAAGDIDGDGFDDLAIGVPGEDIGSVYNAGVVHVLYGSHFGLTDHGNDYLNQNISTIQGYAEAGDSFGEALAIGDINGDGYFDLAIGVPGEGLGTIAGAGAVNVLYGSISGITTTGNQLLGQHWPSIIDSAEIGDRFGAALAIFP